MKIRIFFLGPIFFLVSAPTTVFAAESCSPAKKLVQAAKAFYGEQPELTNIIAPDLQIFLRGINGHPDPVEMLYRLEEVEQSLPIVGGRVQDLKSAVSWSKDGELCSLYEDDPLLAREGPTVNLSVSFQFPFRRHDGVFQIEEIKEGAKDGSKIIKSLAPSGLGFAAPSLKTFAVTPGEGSHDMPKLMFMREGTPTTVEASKLHKTQYVRLKDIKSAKVDSLRIEGSYKAFAFFKIDPDEVAKQEASRLKALESD